MLGALMYGLLYFCFNMWRIGWLRWRVIGLENLPPREEGGMVIVMNHVNVVDIPVIGTLLPLSYRLSWLAKAELFEHPVVRWWFREMNVIPIQRGKRDVAAMTNVVTALKQGAVLVIFPEGTRSRSGVLQPGRGGALRMAAQADVPVIPVAITGSEHGPKGLLTRRPVVLTIGQPYRVLPSPGGTIPADQMDRLTGEMMLRIAALLPEERRGVFGPVLAAPKE